MTIEDLAAVVASQQIEIVRLGEMVQTLSESHDLNRRELQVATASAKALGLQLDQHTAQVTELARDLKK